MRKILFCTALLLMGEVSLAQESKDNPLSKKGQVFVFWGWNRAMYSNSDIRFKGVDYDFTLKNVIAKDRPTEFGLKDYFHPGRVTIPQTNAKIGYFIKDDVALVLALDHMKYVMKQEQTVEVSGYVSNAYYRNRIKNNQIDLSDGEFLKYEHTDGLNYVNIGLEKYKTILDKNKFDIVWSYGGGLGVLYPKTNATLMDFERSDRFHIAGFGLDVRSSLNFVLWNHVLLRIEGKYGYINMPDVKTTLNNRPDKAMQDFVFGQVNFGIGYTFNTRKSK